MCLSENQANYVYKKVEEDEVINVNTLKQELEHDLDTEDNNPYKKVVLNKVYRDKDKTPQVKKIAPYLLTKLSMSIMMKGLHTD